MKYIDSDKLIFEIKRLLEAHSSRYGYDEVGLNLEYLEDFIAILQKEQPNNVIQWTGNNLKEVIDFTGKSPRFEEWFNSWKEYENYVHTHNDILKLFCEDGSHYEVPVGAWIVKTPDGYNVPSVARFIHAKHEQSEADLENYISSKLRELGADLTDPFNHGFNAGKTNAYNDILDKLNVRKEESVSVAESPSSTFPRVNEFDCGSSYRH